MERKKIKKNYKLLSDYDFFTPGPGGIGMLLVWFLAGAVLGNIITIPILLLFRDNPDASQYAMLVAYPIMFIPPMLYASYKSRANSFFGTGFKLSNGHYSPIGGVMCAILVSVATLATSFVADSAVALLPPMPESLESMLESMTSGNLIVNLISVSIFAPFFEEWLCRGMILRGLLNYEHTDKEGRKVRGIKPGWAIAVSALIFALIHGNPWQAIAAFSLGMLFGYVYYRTGSIKLTMLMHCVNNTFAVILSNIDSLKDIDGWWDALPPALFWAIFAFCTVFVVYFIQKFQSIKTLSPQGSCAELLSE